MKEIARANLTPMITGSRPRAGLAPLHDLDMTTKPDEACTAQDADSKSSEIENMTIFTPQYLGNGGGENA